MISYDRDAPRQSLLQGGDSQFQVGFNESIQPSCGSAQLTTWGTCSTQWANRTSNIVFEILWVCTFEGFGPLMFYKGMPHQKSSHLHTFVVCGQCPPLEMSGIRSSGGFGLSKSFQWPRTHTVATITMTFQRHVQRLVASSSLLVALR